MHKFFLIPKSLGLVLVFGLLSCAKEKRTDDSFSVGTPEIQTMEVRLQATNGNVPGTVFSAASNVDFPALKKLNLATDPIHIEALTSCRGELRKHQQQYEFLNQSSIRLQDLLPISAFAPNSNDKTLQCLSNFRATNKLGSVHTLTLPNLQVDLSTISEDLDLQVDGRTFNSEQTAISAAETLKIRLVDNDSDDSPRASFIHLLCEGFRSKVEDRLYRNYGVTKLLEATPEPYAGTELRDPKKFPRQKCRIIRETRKSHRVEVSRIFDVQFEVALPTVTLKTSLFPEGPHPREQVRFAQVEIANPHAHDIALVIPKNQSGGLILQPVEAARGEYLLLEMRSFTINWSVDVASDTSDGSNIKLLLKAGTRAVLTGSTMLKVFCKSNGSGFMKQTGKIGFYYEIPKDKLNMIVPFNNRLDGDLLGVEIPIISKPQQSSRQRPLAGWLPFGMNPHVTGFNMEKMEEPPYAKHPSPEDQKHFLCGWGR